MGWNGTLIHVGCGYGRGEECVLEGWKNSAWGQKGLGGGGGAEEFELAGGSSNRRRVAGQNGGFGRDFGMKWGKMEH